MDVFLTEDTAPIAAGHEIVSTSVNADLGGTVLEILAAGGTRMVAQRSTGFNNIDLDAAERLGLTVARVSSYSPYSVAEFAWALALAVNRRIVRASTRTRDFDFRLHGLMGRDMHGRTAGVLGTGRIGEAFARIAHGFGMNLLGWDVAREPGLRRTGHALRPEGRAVRPLRPGHPARPADARDPAPDRRDRAEVDAGRRHPRQLQPRRPDRHHRPRRRTARRPLHRSRARRVRGGGGPVLPRQVPGGHRRRHPGPPRHLPQRPGQFAPGVLHEDAVGQIVDTTARNILDYREGRRSENVLVPRS